MVVLEAVKSYSDVHAMSCDIQEAHSCQSQAIFETVLHKLGANQVLICPYRKALQPQAFVA